MISNKFELNIFTCECENENEEDNGITIIGEQVVEKPRSLQNLGTRSIEFPNHIRILVHQVLS